MKDLTQNEITTLSVLLSREYDRLNMTTDRQSNLSVVLMAEQEMTEIRDLYNKINK